MKFKTLIILSIIFCSSVSLADLKDLEELNEIVERNGPAADSFSIIGAHIAGASLAFVGAGLTGLPATGHRMYLQSKKKMDETKIDAKKIKDTQKIFKVFFEAEFPGANNHSEKNIQKLGDAVYIPKSLLSIYLRSNNVKSDMNRSFWDFITYDDLKIFLNDNRDKICRKPYSTFKTSTSSNAGNSTSNNSPSNNGFSDGSNNSSYEPEISSLESRLAKLNGNTHPIDSLESRLAKLNGNTHPKEYLSDDADMKKMKAKHNLSDEKEGNLEKAILETWDAGDSADVSKILGMLTKPNCNNQTKEDKWTPIMILAGLGKAEGTGHAIRIARLFGADPTIKDNEGWNALHWAAYHNNPEAAQVLVAGDKTLLDSTDNQGHTPLRTAELEGNGVVAGIIRIASAGRYVPATGDEGDSAYDNNGFSDDEDSYNGFSDDDDDDENDDDLTVFELIDSENIAGLNRFVSGFSSADDMNQAFKDEMREKGENSLKYAIRVKNTDAVRIIGEKAESLKIISKKRLDKYISDSK